MGAVDEAVGMQDFEILANRNLRSFELAREFGDQNPALVGEQIENGAATFFVEHGNIACGEPSGRFTARLLHASYRRQCRRRFVLPDFFL